MSRQKALVIFSPAFPKDEQDQLWLPWLQALVKAINKNYSSLKVIVFAFQAPAVTNKYSWNDNLVLPFNGLNKNRVARLLMWKKIEREFDEINKAYDIKGIFSMWCHECAYIAKKIANANDVKHYCWLLGGDANVTNPYVKKIKPSGNELVAASDFLYAEFLKNHHVKPAHVMYHGIDATAYSKNTEQRNIDVIGVGNLCALKQYDLFIEIVTTLKNTFPSINVVLCGDGEDREKLERMIIDFSLTGHITMKGMLPNNEVLQLMQQSKILMHTSSYEGFGTVCTEALYAGANVVSFCKPLYKKVENWYNVPGKDEMISTMHSLLQKKSLNHQSVMVQHINDTAKEVINLFVS